MHSDMPILSNLTWINEIQENIEINEKDLVSWQIFSEDSKKNAQEKQNGSMKINK